MTVTPEHIRPFVKAPRRKRKSNAGKGRTRVLTDTPEKEEIIMKQVAKKNKTSSKVCKTLTAASESDSESDETDPPLLSDDEDCSESSSAGEEEMMKVNQQGDIQDGDFALVKFSVKRI